MRICVIGAGAAGLAAVRHLVHGEYQCLFECVVFEQTGQVGGTWYYDQRVGTDEYGLPIHTSMYKNLRTNLPKEVMGYPDFPIQEQHKSYIPAKEIFNFLNLYTDQFKLLPHIKFRHLVQNVKKVSEESGGRKTPCWEVTVKNLVNNETTTERFDGVMVCNGHYHTPMVPLMDGIDQFQGEQIHCHDYRTPDIFTDKRVMVIGAGPSGMDLTLEVSKTAKQVFMSHHLPNKIDTVFPSNVSQRTDVLKVGERTVHFKDGSQAEIDSIFYCTGYRYNFPFLDDSCGIQVVNNHVQPLFKHMFNIHSPSMVFIGIPFYVCAFALFDLQSRIYLKWMNHGFQLPDDEQMHQDLLEDTRRRVADGLGNKHAHQMGYRQGEYYEELKQLSGEDGIPPVMTKMHNDSSDRFLNDLVNYRNDIYSIIDDENFVCVKEGNL